MEDKNRPPVVLPNLPPRMPNHFRPRRINVALLGLGSIGEMFAENLLEKIQENKLPINLVAIAEHNLDASVAQGFAQNGVPVFQHALEVMGLDSKADIIFDLTGDSRLRRAIRLQLRESNNRHTVIAPEIVAWLFWLFFTGKKTLPIGVNTGY